MLPYRGSRIMIQRPVGGHHRKVRKSGIPGRYLVGIPLRIGATPTVSTHILGGAWRGRRLAVPALPASKPTTGQVREAIFSMLTAGRPAGRPDIVPNARVLDLFACSGALGLEALSRGAATAVMVESHPLAIQTIRHNVAHCAATDRCVVLCADALRPATYQTALQRAVRPARHLPEDPSIRMAWYPFDLVLLDPPYRCGGVPAVLTQLERAGILQPGAIVVAEHEADLADVTGTIPWSIMKQRRYGDTAVTLWQWSPEQDPEQNTEG